MKIVAGMRASKKKTTSKTTTVKDKHGTQTNTQDVEENATESIESSTSNENATPALQPRKSIDSQRAALDPVAEEENEVLTAIYNLANTVIANAASRTLARCVARSSLGKCYADSSQDELASCFIYQVGALTGFLKLHGVELNHVCPLCTYSTSTELIAIVDQTTRCSLWHDGPRHEPCSCGRWGGKAVRSCVHGSRWDMPSGSCERARGAIHYRCARNNSAIPDSQH